MSKLLEHLYKEISSYQEQIEEIENDKNFYLNEILLLVKEKKCNIKKINILEKEILSLKKEILRLDDLNLLLIKEKDIFKESFLNKIKRFFK